MSVTGLCLGGGHETTGWRRPFADLKRRYCLRRRAETAEWYACWIQLCSGEALTVSFLGTGATGHRRDALIVLLDDVFSALDNQTF